MRRRCARRRARPPMAVCSLLRRAARCSCFARTACCRSWRSWWAGARFAVVHPRAVRDPRGDSRNAAWWCDGRGIATFALAWAPVLVVAVLAGSRRSTASRTVGRAADSRRWEGPSALGHRDGALGARDAATACRPDRRRGARGAWPASPWGGSGAFLAGCCYGRPTDLPWGVIVPELGPPARHPLQLYAAAFDLLLATMVARAGRPPGTRAARAAIGFGAGRLLLEQLRDPAAMDPPLAGVWTAPAGAVLSARRGHARIHAASGRISRRDVAACRAPAGRARVVARSPARLRSRAIAASA